MTGQQHLASSVQIIYTSLQTDNHAKSLTLNFLQAGCFFWRRVNDPIIGTHPVIGNVCDILILQINSRFMMPFSVFDCKPEQ